MIRCTRIFPREGRLTFKNKEVVLVRFGERDELDNRRVICPPHDLDLFEDVGALWKVKEEGGRAIDKRQEAKHKGRRTQRGREGERAASERLWMAERQQNLEKKCVCRKRRWLKKGGMGEGG